MSRVSLFAGTRKGLFVLESNDDRTGWSVREPALRGWRVSNVAADHRAESKLFAAVNHFVYGPTVHVSTDDGRSWEQVSASPAYGEGADHEVNEVWTVVPGSADDPELVYAGVDEAGLFASRDGGDTWSVLEGLSDHETRERWMPGAGGLCCHSVLVSPRDPDRLWAGISAVGVFRSDDGGETWTLKNDGLATVDPDPDPEADDALGSCVHRLVLDPDHPDRLYQQNHVGVFRSTDAADSWERIDDDLPSTFGFPMVLHPRDRETLYTFPLESDEHRMAAGGAPAVYRTTDAGDSWHRLDDGLPTDRWVTVLRHGMATDDRSPAGVYAGTTGGSIFYSADDGETWGEIDCELPRILSLTAVTEP